MSLCPICQLPDCSWTAEGVCEGTMEPHAVAARARRREEAAARRHWQRWLLPSTIMLGTLIWWLLT